MRCPKHPRVLVLTAETAQSGYYCEDCRGIWLPYRHLQAIELLYQFSASDFFQELRRLGSVPTDLFCPTGCGTLQRSRQQALELDWCTSCKGVWFDALELDALLKRSPPSAVARSIDIVVNVLAVALFGASKN